MLIFFSPISKLTYSALTSHARVITESGNISRYVYHFFRQSEGGQTNETDQDLYAHHRRSVFLLWWSRLTLLQHRSTALYQNRPPTAQEPATSPDDGSDDDLITRTRAGQNTEFEAGQRLSMEAGLASPRGQIPTSLMSQNPKYNEGVEKGFEAGVRQQTPSEQMSDQPGVGTFTASQASVPPPALPSPSPSGSAPGLYNVFAGRYRQVKNNNASGQQASSEASAQFFAGMTAGVASEPRARQLNKQASDYFQRDLNYNAGVQAGFDSSRDQKVVKSDQGALAVVPTAARDVITPETHQPIAKTQHVNKNEDENAKTGEIVQPRGNLASAKVVHHHSTSTSVTRQQKVEIGHGDHSTHPYEHKKAQPHQHAQDSKVDEKKRRKAWCVSIHNETLCIHMSTHLWHC